VKPEPPASRKQQKWFKRILGGASAADESSEESSEDEDTAAVGDSKALMDELPRPFVRTSSKATVRLLKKYLAQQLHVTPEEVSIGYSHHASCISHQSSCVSHCRPDIASVPMLHDIRLKLPAEAKC